MIGKERYEFSAGALCLDLANTWPDRTDAASDRLAGYSDVLAWSQNGGVLDRTESTRLRACAEEAPDTADAVFDVTVELREAIFRIFSAAAADNRPERRDVERLNVALQRALPRLRLVARGGGCEWRWAAADDSLDRMLWPVARSAADLLTSDELDRVRHCAADNCSWLFLDRSRNGSRRWCDMATCGNRAKARRYYRRHRRGTG